jgi:hypothetical protein
MPNHNNFELLFNLKKNMKKLFFTFIVLTAIFSSCKKETCPVVEPPVNLSGTTFKGIAIISGITYNPFTIVFSADGTCTVTFQGYPAFPGTWNKTPSSSVVYLFFTESPTNSWKGQGTLNSTNNKLEGGTLTRTTPTVITGTFTADKL